jgi:hypothetical protein
MTPSQRASLLPITQRILEFEQASGRNTHRSGTLSIEALNVMERLCPGRFDVSIETGCGKSTVLLSNLSARHLVFTFDDRDDPEGSVPYFEENPIYRPEPCRTIFGATQKTVPRYDFPRQIDFALLDGPHGFPFPQLEYYFVYPFLRRSAILVIDDIHIPHIGDMFRLLAEDDMYEFVDIAARTTGFLRRTGAPARNPFGDEWTYQRYNTKSFPAFFMNETLLEPGMSVDFAVAAERERFAVLGWSPVEEWGSWSDGKEALLSFRVPEAGNGLGIEFRYAARAPVDVTMNREPVGQLPATEGGRMDHASVAIGAALLDPDGPNLLGLRPQETFTEGEFPRERALGIAVGAMRRV